MILCIKYSDDVILLQLTEPKKNEQKFFHRHLGDQ